jgi:signal transduction histidine kinase
MTKKRNQYLPLFLLALIYISSIVFIAAEKVLGYWYWRNEPVHSTVEAIGALVALLAAYLLYVESNDRIKKITGLILGFLGMGILDTFHSLASPGQGFVFLRSASGFIGGAGFFSVVFRNNRRSSLSIQKAMAATILLSVAVGTWGLFFQETLPVMVRNDIFTYPAYALNLFSGIFFTTGGLSLFTLYRKEWSFDYYLFFSIALLFGLSGFTFEFSELWHGTWWFWHFVRLGAFFVLIGYILYSYSESHTKIISQNREISDINKKLENYSYTISHDLKEPIRSIRSFSEFIVEDYGEVFDDTARDYFNRIIIASSKMSNMIDDLLVLSRVGRTDIVFKRADISGLLDEVIYNLGSMIKESGAGISYHEMPVIICQPFWIKMVFSNLIGNCIKYRDEKKGKPLITISCTEYKFFFEFSVTDNGIGIEPDQHEKIFGLFRKASKINNIEGSGAGLAIVSSVIDQHNGRVWVRESVPGKGTTISFTIKKRGEAL